MQIKPLQLVGQTAEFKFESKFEPLQVRWQAIPEDNQKFWLQNQWRSSLGRALAQLWLVWQASTKTEADAAGIDWLAWRILPLLRYWLSSGTKKALMLCNYWAFVNFLPCWVTFFFMWNEIFNGIGFNWQKVVTNQSSTENFAQAFDHSLVSGYKSDIGTKHCIQNWILCKAADRNQLPVQEKDYCSEASD